MASSLTLSRASYCCTRRPVSAAVPCPARRGRAALRVKATYEQPPQGPLANVRANVDVFFKRYDVLSTGMGTLVVTSYCVSRGQDPWTALSITFSATVMALVVNELMFNKQQ